MKCLPIVSILATDVVSQVCPFKQQEIPAKKLVVCLFHLNLTTVSSCTLNIADLKQKGTLFYFPFGTKKMEKKRS